jgi:uncharacterized protein YcbK (DUF882 family)
MPLVPLLALACLIAPSLARAGECAAADEESGELSKKAQVLADKETRKPVRARRAPAPAAQPLTSFKNLWTNEVVVAEKGTALSSELFGRLTRCHFTNQAAEMDPRLPEVLRRAVEKFQAETVQVVSGFRAPKYQLMLRKKGREVARDSQHPRGNAVDFRLPGVPLKVLLKFVRSLGVGGVGYYPESRFVHADVGPVRFWKGH